MAVRYVEFFDLGPKSAVTYLNEFIKAHPFFEVEPIQFAFDNEGQSSILARVRGTGDECRILDLDYEKNSSGDLDGFVM